MTDLAGLRDKLVQHQQQHLLSFWDDLTDDEKHLLYKDLSAIDFNEISRIWKEAGVGDKSSPKTEESLPNLDPLPKEVHESVVRSSSETLKSYRREGLKQISEGKVAALLLAGGQGTRLGVSYPKGMYDVGLPSHKSLFQLQAERLRKLAQLASQETGCDSCHIPWYIMTSEQTKGATEKFFKQRSYFGLRPEDIFIFEQSTLPCFTTEGKIILDEKYKVSRAPDGNGGLYYALKNENVLQDMKERGVEYVHVYCVDNILVKMADPTFIGYCVTKGAEAGAKVVEKTTPHEKVGIICRVDDKFQVVEYSEITADIAEKREPDGRLTFNAGSICNHFFTLDFLKSVSEGQPLKHHVAEKKIPFVALEGLSRGLRVQPNSVNGIKLEKFVFDVFSRTQNFVVWEVLREEEFSPLKNGPTEAKDTAVTARRDLYDYHRSQITRAGGRIITSTAKSVTRCSPMIMDGVWMGQSNSDSEVVVEISPLVSYDGEGLEDLVYGKTFEPPVIIDEDIDDISSELHNNQHSNGITKNGVHCNGLLNGIEIH